LDAFVSAVWRRRWTVVLTMAVALAVVGGLTALQTPRYETTATLRISTPPSADGIVRADDLEYADRLANTYRMIVGTRPIRQELERRLGPGSEPDVSVSLPANSELFEVKAADADADRAAAAANAMADILIDRVARPQSVTVVEPAQAPARAASPNWVLNLTLGGIIGLLGGLALAVLLDRRDTSLRDIDRIEHITQTSVLAEIPSPAAEIQLYNTGSTQEEAFRTLRSSLMAVERRRELGTVLFIGTRPGPQPAGVAANVATALAMAGKNIVVVDADLRDSRLHRAFKVGNGTGLGDVLQGAVEWEDVLRPAMQHRLNVVTAGPPPLSPGQLLASTELDQMLVNLRTRFETVVLTSAPFLTVADADLLVPSVDGVVLVLERGRAREEEAARAARRLGLLNATLLGVVVVDAPRPRREKSRFLGRDSRRPERVGDR
jgi:succinoglycan biosynthesis transport protein ExoP